MRFVITLLRARLKDRRMSLSLILLATLATSAMLAVVGGMFQLVGARSQKTVEAVIGPIDRIIISGTVTDWESAKTRYGNISAPAPISQEITDFVENSANVKRTDLLTYARVELLNPKKKFSGSMYRPGHTRPTPVYCVKDDQMPPAHLVPGLTKEIWEKCLKLDQVILPEMKGYFGGGGDILYKSGDTILVTSENASNKIVVASTYPTKGRLRNFGGMFVSQKIFTKLTGCQPKTNRIYVELKDSTENTSAKFDSSYNKVAASVSMPSAMLTQEDYIDYKKLGGGFGILPFSGTVLTIIGAFFIIFFVVGIGNKSQINESLGLRALGISKGRLVIVVVLETVIPALLGCVIGLIIARILFQLGIQSGRGGMSFNSAENLGINIYNMAVLLMAPACVLITMTSSLVAVIPVALAIYRKHPLEARTTQSLQSVNVKRVNIPLILGAIALIAVNPLIASSQILPDKVRWFGVPLTYICALVGLLLIINPLVSIWQAILITPMSIFCKLDKKLLKNFLAIHRSKIAVGTASVVIGLGLFIATYIWGNSMKTPFLMTEKTPDISTVTFPAGLSDAEVFKLSKTPFLKKFVPMHIQHPTVSDNQVKQIKLVHGDWRDLILIGVKDLNDVFGETQGIMQGQIIQGDPATCFDKVNKGKGVIITAELYRTNEKLYQVGNGLEIQKLSDNSVHTREIVAVIEMPGWHMFTKSTRMRRGLGRLSGLVFASDSLVKELYPASQMRCFWMNLDKSKLPKTDLAKTRIKEKTKRPAGRRGGRPQKPASASVKAVELLFGKIIDKKAGDYLRVVDTAEMNRMVQERCRRVIDMAAKLPYYALLLSAIAIAATAAASIRVRAQEIGILRAVGASSSQLFRLLLIENLIIMAAAIVLGVTFGLLVSWSGVIVSAGSWGISAPYIIPWSLIGKGCLVSIGAGAVGVIIPVLFAVKKDTLSLLKEQEEQ